jgi:ArsR family transcriptional regulator
VSQQQPTAQLISEEKLAFATRMFKLLGHPLRLRLVEILEVHGEKTVNDLAEMTQQPQSSVSLYLNRLKNSGLLSSRRDGNQSFYSIREPKLPILLDCLRDCKLD